MKVVWHGMHWTDRALFWAFAVLMLLAILRVFRPTGHAKERRDGSLYFGLSWVGLCSYGFFVAATPLVARGIHWSIDRLPPDSLAWIFVGIVVSAVFFDSPNTILVNSESVQQVRWLLPNKRIRWTEIVEINAEKRDGSVAIKDGKGTKVIHGIFLADRPRFLLEIKKYFPQEFPADFPGEPINRAAGDDRRAAQ